jgi:hypothetical protein
VDRSVSGAGRLDQLRGMARGLISLSSRFEPYVPGYRPTLAETMQLLGTLERWTRQSLASLLPPAPATAVPPADPFHEPTAATAPVPASAATAVATPPPAHAGIGASAARQGAGTPIGDPLLSRYSSMRVEHQGTVRNPSLVQALLALQSRRGPRTPGRGDIIKRDGASAGVPARVTVPPTHAGAETSRFAGADFMVEELPLIEAVVPKPGPAVRTREATQTILRAAPNAAVEPGHEPPRGSP